MSSKPPTPQTDDSNELESVRPPASRAKEGSRLAFGVASAAVVGGVVSGILVVAMLAGVGVRDTNVLATVMATAFATGLIAFVLVRNLYHRRLSRVVAFVEQRITDRTTPRYLPVFDDDELGRVVEAVQRLVATQPKAPTPADQSQREEALAVTIAQQAEELARRVREQTLLFEVLRESTSSHDVSAVLDMLARKLGPVLDLHHGAVLLSRADGGYDMGVSWGNRETLNDLETVLVVDRTGTATSDQPELAKWFAREDISSSFTSIPLQVRDTRIGLLVVGRPLERPLNEIEKQYLVALGSHIALAIHNAQLFHRLDELSTTDELTRLPNRRYFRERLLRDFAEARRYGNTFSVLMLDVDHFKKLNDREGHPIGDAALVMIGKVLRASLREVDTLARWGGEEFMAVLSHASKTSALEVGEKLRAAVYAIDEEWSRSQPGGHITVSIGVSECTQDEIERSAEAELIQRADRATYIAKRDGRNCVRSA